MTMIITLILMMIYLISIMISIDINDDIYWCWCIYTLMLIIYTWIIILVCKNICYHYYYLHYNYCYFHYCNYNEYHYNYYKIIIITHNFFNLHILLKLPILTTTTSIISKGLGSGRITFGTGGRESWEQQQPILLI